MDRLVAAIITAAIVLTFVEVRSFWVGSQVSAGLGLRRFR
jgi:hypothetical protein